MTVEPGEGKVRHPRRDTPSDLGVSVTRESLLFAREIATTSKLRVDIPVRRAFVRDAARSGETPLSVLVSTRGRGNSVAIKLYLALIWRCAAPPFDTSVPPRKWAALLSLDDPDTAGAKRVSEAFKRLERAKLVRLTPNPGQPSTVTLLEESGTGADYTLPSTAYVRATNEDRERHLYFKLPVRLWTGGHIQTLSAPALAVLLAVLSSQERPGKAVWWTTSLFPAQFGLSPATRARGTAELKAVGLLSVTKRRVAPSAYSGRQFSEEQVRNVYKLVGAAGPPKIKKRPLRRAVVQ